MFGHNENNHTSALEFENHVDAYIAEEVKFEVMLGPTKSLFHPTYLLS